MPYEFYKILHFAGIFATLLALGGVGTHMIAGGTKENFPARKWLGMLHGMGLVMVLVAGFGLHARLLPGESIQPWAWAKLGVWLTIGAAPVAFYRAPKFAKVTWWIVLALACTAALLAIFKPF